MKCSVHTLVKPMKSDNFSLESPFSTNTMAAPQPVSNGGPTQASHGTDAAAVEKQGEKQGNKQGRGLTQHARSTRLRRRRHRRIFRPKRRGRPNRTISGGSR